MRAMKDSGIAWIGEIPEEWEIKKLKYTFFHSNAGEVIDKSYWNCGSELLYTCQKEPINSNYSGFPEAKRTGINDLLLTRNATPYVFIPETHSIYSNVVQRISLRQEYDRRYIRYSLLSAIDSLVALGDTIPSYNMEIWENITLPIMQQQHRIADYLDHKCSQIDAIIARQQEVIEKLKAYKLSVITEAVTKGLNPHAPMKDSGVEWIGEIPEQWEVMKFGRCATIKSNLVAPDDYADYPQISPDSIEKNSGRIIDYKTVKEVGVISWNHLFFKGQVIYSKIRPMLNKVAIAPFDGLCSADMYPIETSNNTQFLVYLMLSDYFTSQVGLVTENRVKMPKINQNELSAIMVTIPPQSEQETISKYLSEKCASLDVVIDKKQGLIYKLNTYKKSLIYEVVTGKKEV